jgi:hypothetical protein
VLPVIYYRLLSLGKVEGPEMGSGDTDNFRAFPGQATEVRNTRSRAICTFCRTDRKSPFNPVSFWDGNLLAKLGP